MKKNMKHEYVKAMADGKVFRVLGPAERSSLKYVLDQIIKLESGNKILCKLVQEVYDNAWANGDDWNNRAKVAIDERGDE